MNHISHLQQLTDAKDWHSLRAAATQALASKTEIPVLLFFLSLAELRIGNLQASLHASKKGLVLSGDSFWGIALCYEALSKLDQHERALSSLSEFVNNNPRNLQGLNMLVTEYAEKGYFDNALIYNEARLVSLPKSRSRKALAIQCFAKPDTLVDLFSSILDQQSTDWSLIVWQDGLVGSKQSDRYAADAIAVSSVIDRYLPLLGTRFADIRVVRSEANLGTAPSCKRLLDLSFESNDYVVFFEDDCILAPSALQWFDGASALLSDSNWFVAGESPFFNSGSVEVSLQMTEKFSALARSPEIASKFVLDDFVPSTCFATTAEIWKKCGDVRGLPRGALNISSYMKRNGGRTIFPTVSYVKDVGMHHENGYSVMMLGKGGVKEVKNQFVTSESFSISDLRELEISRHLLFKATSRLDSVSLETLIKTVTLPPNFLE